MKTKLLILLIAFIPYRAFADPSPTPADKLQSALADAVTKSIQAAGDATDFLIGQLPDVIKQFLMWKMVESIAWNVVSVIGVLAMIAIVRKFLAKGRQTKWDWEDRLFPFAIGSFLFCFVIAISTFNFNLDWLQIWVAPKVYLIEYAKAAIGK